MATDVDRADHGVASGAREAVFVARGSKSGHEAGHYSR
jgi:hypothetical protein